MGDMEQIENGKKAKNSSQKFKCENIIATAIDTENEKRSEETRQRKKLGEKCYPNSDFSIWFRECTEEVVEPLKGTIEGKVPEWLKGSLYRNGPGSLTVGESHFNHIFDGQALLHRFFIRNGSVEYMCRFIKSDTFLKNQKAQRIVVSEFGTRAVPDPCKTIFQKFTSIFKYEFSDNCMISVYPNRDELYAYTESPITYKIDPESLETLEKTNASKYVNVIHHSAHPHVEEDGTVYNIGISVGISGPKYSFFVFPNTKKGSTVADKFDEAKILAKVSPRWSLHPSYMHSFGITENYFVLVEQPLSMSVPALAFYQLSNDPLYKSLVWYGDHKTLIHLSSRKTGKNEFVFETEPFFYFHTINQFEVDGHLILDVCAYKNAEMIDCMLVEAMKNVQENPDYASLFRGRPTRFVMPLKDLKNKSETENLVTLPWTTAKAYKSQKRVHLVPELLANVGIETPQINYNKYLGKNYRYFYGISSDVDADEPGSIIKVDTKDKSHKSWSLPGTFPCEPIFTSSPNAKDEDDGVLLTSLLHVADDKKVTLAILCAKTLKEIALAEFSVPTQAPKCLHGWFMGS